MLIHKKQITDCICAAQEVSRLFEMHTRQNGDLDRSSDDFREVCENYGAISIRVHDLAYTDGFPIRGGVLVFDDRYEVFILANQKENYWDRFVEFKELFHVILDSLDKDRVFRNSDFVKQVEQTITAFPDMDNRAENWVAVEQLAEIAAMEFLIPFARREQLSKKLNSGEIAITDLVDKYRLPANKIELYLSENYIEKIGQCMPEIKVTL